MQGELMGTVEIIDRETVAILRLNNGVTNAINPELIEDISAAVEVVKREFRGVVMAGGAKFFCIGLDLPRVIHFGRTEMSEFFYRFNDLVLALFTLPLPTCCAVCGHATAGGAVLALTGDFRFGAAGKKFIGLNEVKLGVPAPYLADLILRQTVGDRAATEMLYGGEYVTTSDAGTFGLVDEVLPQEEVEDRAVEKVTRLAALPQAAFSAIKSNRVEMVKARYEAAYKSRNEVFIDCWFSQPVRELLKEASRKFSKS
jgi:enoyl-CoA hydratase/carnithine racemase